MSDFKLSAPPGYTGQPKQRPRGGAGAPAQGFDNDFDPFNARQGGNQGILRDSGSKHKDTHVNFPASVSTVIPSSEQAGDDEDYVLYQALYNYNSGDPDDLVFEANDILQVTDEGDGPTSWMEGRTQDGRFGTFPGNYVRKIVLQPRKSLNLDMENGGVAKKEVAAPDGSEDEAMPAEDDVQAIRFKAPAAATPAKSAAPAPAKSTTFSAASAKAAPAAEKDIGKFVYYQTLYAYNSGEDGDLVFEANEILRVTDEGEDGSGWFYGFAQDNREGSFPSNFVRKIKYQPGATVSVKLAGLEHTQ